MGDLKVLIVVALAAIVFNLGKAMFHMSSGTEQSEKTVRALTARISLSIALFLLLMIGSYFGLISPHTVGH